MKRFRVIAKPSKCQFCQKEVTYLGHRVGKGKLRMDKHNVEKILNMRMPGTLKEIRSFVCLAGYYRRFIKGFRGDSKTIDIITIEGGVCKIEEEKEGIGRGSNCRKR